MKKEEIKDLLDKFEAAANIVEGIECWSARELQPLLGYAKWDNFIKNVVVKAKEACRHAGEEIQNHFPDVGKMVLYFFSCMPTCLLCFYYYILNKIIPLCVSQQWLQLPGAPAFYAFYNICSSFELI